MTTRLRRLVSHALFRPRNALLLFGALTLTSGWFWFGAGLFLGHGWGLAVWLAGVLAAAFAVLALIRGRYQLPALCLLISTAVALPTLALMGLRWKTGAPILMHDGAYQTEEAIRLVLSGQNPYGVDYSQTSMRLWHWYVNQPLDPSLFHYVYGPLTFLLSLPGLWLSRLVSLPYDVRLTLLLAEGVGAVAILKLPWRWEWRYVCLAALFLDPFFYMPQGRNDILFLAPLLLAVLAWERGYPLLASLGLGVALALKPFIVFFLPLFLLMLVLRKRSEPWSFTRFSTMVLALVLPALISIGPFFVWNPGAYWSDTMSFVAGTDPHSYPIQGYGLSHLLLLLHVIPSPNAHFPFVILELAVGLPVFAFGLRRVWGRPQLAGVLFWGTATLTAVLLCSRFVNDNYLAVLIFLAVLAGTARRAEALTVAASEPPRRRFDSQAAAAVDFPFAS